MSEEARNGNLPVGPLVASIGAILLIVSLFLDWYEGDIEGFTVFEFLDLLLVLLALATIASLAGGLGLIRPAPSPSVSLAVALFTVFVVASQVVNDPPAVAFNDELGRETGIWLALGGSVLMAIGGLLAFARISLAFETRSHERAQGPGRAGDGPDTVTTPLPVGPSAPDAPDKPTPEPGRPVATTEDPDPTRPLDDPDGPGTERS
jgi:hypothetical protein